MPHVTRRLTFVCLVFYPDTSAAGQLFTDLFCRMAADGWSITVLCGFPAKQARVPVASLPRHEIYQGIEIRRCGLRLEGKRSLLARALAYGSFLAHAGWRLSLLSNRGIVLGSTDPPFTAVALRALSPIGRFRYQLNLLDLYPEGLVAGGLLGKRSPAARAWSRLNRGSYRAAERLIVIGRDMAGLLAERYHIAPDRISYVPLWATAEMEAEPPDGAALRAELHLSGKFLVQYSGNMGLWHDLDSFIYAASRLRNDDRIHFLFIGGGMRRRRAETLSRDLQLTNITWLDFLPRERLPETLAACDLALISLRAGMEGIAVPSKLYGILASSRPILATVPEGSEVALTVREEACGVVTPPGDVDALVAGILRLAADPDECERMGRAARRAYLARYTIARAGVALDRLWLGRYDQSEGEWA